MIDAWFSDRRHDAPSISVGKNVNQHGCLNDHDMSMTGQVHPEASCVPAPMVGAHLDMKTLPKIARRPNPLVPPSCAKVADGGGI